ncbi:MAG: hypothetical protein Q8W51_03995 [Candidatus Palauibacterales bacterium]|nr:hypothetical protein [Candidatus Palauibacterales bacterium]MDP2528873.1 hypothetical protein [Candidatus Palauibacterales bacterium]
MAKTIESVMSMVEAELKKNSAVSNETLYGKAQKIDGSIKDLTLRQFHARYPLQVKRRMAASSGRRKSGKKARRGTRAKAAATPDAGRQAVRDVLLRFARDVSAADGKAAMIDLVTGLDKYVDQVLRATDRVRR